jgi:hypothetical protein
MTTNFDRALRAAAALSRHQLGRGTTITDIGDAILAEGISLVIADRGRAETAAALRGVAEYLEATNG